MDNATKAIMIGVGLFITVIIISAVLVVVNLGTGAMNNAASSMGSVLENMKSPLDLKGTKLSGAQVKALMEKSQNGEFNYPITVYHNATGSGDDAVAAAQAIVSPTGQGYKVIAAGKNSLSALGLNPIYSRVNSAFYGFERADDDADGLSIEDAAEYTCYVIQSSSNSQIGVFFVK